MPIEITWPKVNSMRWDIVLKRNIQNIVDAIDALAEGSGGGSITTLISEAELDAVTEAGSYILDVTDNVAWPYIWAYCNGSASKLILHHITSGNGDYAHQIMFLPDARLIYERLGSLTWGWDAWQKTETVRDGGLAGQVYTKDNYENSVWATPTFLSIPSLSSLDTLDEYGGFVGVISGISNIGTETGVSAFNGLAQDKVPFNSMFTQNFLGFMAQYQSIEVLDMTGQRKRISRKRTGNSYSLGAWSAWTVE